MSRWENAAAIVPPVIYVKRNSHSWSVTVDCVGYLQLQTIYVKKYVNDNNAI